MEAVTSDIENIIAYQYAVKTKRNWDKWYWCVDIHDTILKANYSQEISTDWIDNAKEALRELSKRKDIVLILWTCSHAREIEKYQEFFKINSIKFDYINENPEIVSTEYGSFDKKPYYNLMIDDKCQVINGKFWENVLNAVKQLKHEQ